MALPIEELKDRFRATLLGGAIGDALGFPYVDQPAEVIEKAKNCADEFVNRPRGCFRRGQYSDDTQMTIALARSIAASGGRFDPSVFASRLAEYWRTGHILFPDRLCAEAARRLLDGDFWNQSGAGPEHEGVGAMARAAPLGLLFHDEPDRIPRVAEKQASVTHKNLISQAGAAAFATAVALNLGEIWYVPASYCAKIAAAAAALAPELARPIESIAGLAQQEPARAFRAIAELGPPPRPGMRRSARVVPTLAMALYAFLRGGKDFRLCMLFSLRSGGDVDTVAAMTGALFGAKRGVGALPLKLRRQVVDATALSTLGEELFAASEAAKRTTYAAVAAARPR